MAKRAVEQMVEQTVTQVDFHSGVADPVALACRLLRRAARQGVRVQVTAPAELLERLDLALWTHDEQDFVPHVRMPGGPPAVAQRTLIWLAKAALQNGAPRVLMNLGASAPADVSALERVISDLCKILKKTCKRNKRSKPGTFEMLNDIGLLYFCLT